ncbi:response regulator transcription factor [Geomonas sp. Red69]|uniref:response regulator n=1 Tax=Geomonas diazotrophica TaxID=2843197 RepID=UPI001C10D48A|nr:response regulator transcription factor [Geomonas diazotrophica]MBU5637973.1 response regulator transcription factor [Geomonas diazotrophica]
MHKKSVLIVDDHPLFRDGLKSLVERSTDYHTIGEAGSGAEALALARELQPDLITMDISLPDMSGIDAAREIIMEFPKIGVLMLSMHPKVEYISEAFKAGARGYVVKETTSTRLIQAMDALSRGEFFLDGQISPETVGKLMAGTRKEHGSQDECYGLLSPREQQVMRMVAEGVPTREIARRLVLSVKTVDNHRTNLMRKLGVHSKIELVKYAAKLGLIDVDSWK